MLRQILTPSGGATNGERCCLTAGHLFICCCLLILLSSVLLIVSLVTDAIRGLRRPSIAVLALAVLLAVVSGTIAAFVERDLQKRSRLCRCIYQVVCFMEKGERGRGGPPPGNGAETPGGSSDRGLKLGGYCRTE